MSDSQLAGAEISALDDRIPPLASGDRLTRAEFERRDDAMPHARKAELIEGVVYAASPIQYESHGALQASITTWRGVYAAATPGVRAAGGASVPRRRSGWRTTAR